MPFAIKAGPGRPAGTYLGYLCFRSGTYAGMHPRKVLQKKSKDMKRFVTVLVAGSIGLGCAFAQRPQCPAGQMPQRDTISDAQRIEMRVDRLKDRLGLTDDQAGELKELFTRQNQEREEAVAAHREEMKKMADSNRAEVEKILTQEQKEAWEKMRAERPRFGAGPEGRPHHHRHPAPGPDGCKPGHGPQHGPECGPQHGPDKCGCPCGCRN